MIGADWYDVVQQFLSQRPVEPFDDAVLPGTADTGSHDFDTHVG